MDIEYIAGLAITVILGLIGILYKNSVARTSENSKEIKRVDEKTDNRLDSVENRLTKVETKIEK